jgi:hypothetical protein
MVRTWWDAGERWCVAATFSGLKNMPLILGLFLGGSHFGNGGGGLHWERGVLELKFDGELRGAGSA